MFKECEIFRKMGIAYVRVWSERDILTKKKTNCASRKQETDRSFNVDNARSAKSYLLSMYVWRNHIITQSCLCVARPRNTT